MCVLCDCACILNLTDTRWNTGADPEIERGGLQGKYFEATPTFCETFPVDCYPYTKEACPCAIYLVVYLRYLLDGSFGSLMARSVVQLRALT